MDYLLFDSDGMNMSAMYNPEENRQGFGIMAREQRLPTYQLTPNGPYNNGPKIQGSIHIGTFAAPMLKVYHHPDGTPMNGYHPGMMTGNGFNSPCSAPFGSRKRSLDDEDQDVFKRQRISGGYEPSMPIYNGGHPIAPSSEPHYQMAMAARPEMMYNTSVMEHQTTMAEAKGYEDMCLYDIISQMHGS